MFGSDNQDEGTSESGGGMEAQRSAVEKPLHKPGPEELREAALRDFSQHYCETAGAPEAVFADMHNLEFAARALVGDDQAARSGLPREDMVRRVVEAERDSLQGLWSSMQGCKVKAVRFVECVELFDRLRVGLTGQGPGAEQLNTMLQASAGELGMDDCAAMRVVSDAGVSLDLALGRIAGAWVVLMPMSEFSLSN